MQSKKKKQNKENIGITALYCRLSRDDGGEMESNSISNQKKLLAEYAKSKGLENIKYYVDDGYTGTNFNRPGFRQMIEDIELGFVTTVIVKDLSRLGREHVQVGYYTETFFPNKDVRFIAVNDMIDSDEGESEIAPFKNILNEMYAKDISKKIRSSHRLRGNMGEPLSQPPYGYMKSPKNKKKWIIEPEATAVVKDIFSMCMEGKGNETIARILEDRRIMNPMAYWRSKGLPRGGKVCHENPYKWKNTTVGKILANQEYCGDVINFKTYSKSFRNKTRIDNPQENWVIFRDVHEPIIDRETFERVQQLTKKVKQRHLKDPEEEKSLFTNLLYCADCGSRLWYHKSTNKTPVRHFFCSNYKGIRGTCNDHHCIREDALEEIVISELRRLAVYLESDENAFAELLEQKTNADMLAEQKTVESALASANARMGDVIRMYENLYEDNVNGKVSDDMFMRLSKRYEDEKDELKRKSYELNARLLQLTETQTSKDGFTKAIKSFMRLQKLTPTLLHELIDKIKVHAVRGRGKSRTQKIVIHYRFVGVIDLPYIQKVPVVKQTRQGVAINYVSGAETASETA